jgi:hypothetical protein
MNLLFLLYMYKIDLNTIVIYEDYLLLRITSHHIIGLILIYATVLYYIPIDYI